MTKTSFFLTAWLLKTTVTKYLYNRLSCLKNSILLFCLAFLTRRFWGNVTGDIRLIVNTINWSRIKLPQGRKRLLFKNYISLLFLSLKFIVIQTSIFVKKGSGPRFFGVKECFWSGTRHYLTGLLITVNNTNISE